MVHRIYFQPVRCSRRSSSESRDSIAIKLKVIPKLASKLIEKTIIILIIRASLVISKHQYGCLWINIVLHPHKVQIVVRSRRDRGSKRIMSPVFDKVNIIVLVIVLCYIHSINCYNYSTFGMLNSSVCIVGSYKSHVVDSFVRDSKYTKKGKSRHGREVDNENNDSSDSPY